MRAWVSMCMAGGCVRAWIGACVCVSAWVSAWVGVCAWVGVYVGRWVCGCIGACVHGCGTYVRGWVCVYGWVCACMHAYVNLGTNR